jgi:hypothetical protein
MPYQPGFTEPSTIPQIPGTSAGFPSDGAMAMSQVENAYERRIQQQQGDADDQQTLQEETGLAQIGEYRASLAEQADEWEERQERLNSMMEVGDDEDVEAVLETL